VSWPTVKLGDLVRITTGKLDANASDDNGKYPFFTCSVKPLAINTAAFDCKAILVAGNGDLNVKYFEGKFNAYQRTYVITCIEEQQLFVRFLYWFFESYIGELRRLAIGGVIKYIKLPHLTEAKLSLPPLAEQKRIAAILDKADEIKRKREQAIAKLDQLAQSIFVEMFGDALINEKCFVTINLKELAERIQIGPFGSQLHEEDYIEGGIPLINPTHIKLGKIQPDVNLTISKEKFDQLSQYHLVLGDVIIGRRGEMGRCAIVTAKENGWFCGTGSLFVRLKLSKILPEYFSRTISSKSMRKHLENVSQGVTMANLNKDIIGNLLIPLPPLALQEQFAIRISKLEKLKASNVAALEKHNTLFASLQNQAFTGQL
jgi:type I restriction enzyme S subunit